MDGARLSADILHDVDFAALGPANGGNVVAQHPESRPHALPRWNLDARFKPAVSLIEKTLRFDPRRSVTVHRAVATSVAWLLTSCKDEIPALDLGVLSQVGVTLEFLVAPALSARIVIPFGGIWSGTIGAIELIAPDEGITIARRRRLKSGAAPTAQQ